MIFLYNFFGYFSIAAVAKYYFRLKNHTANVLPGDELYLPYLLGYSMTDRFKFRHSNNWMTNRDREQNSALVTNSAKETLAVGADVHYRFFWLSVTFT
ncbi:MAG: transporter [Smithella sp.]|jgi:hypothetical protein